MRAFRHSLARRMALGMLALFAVVAVVSVLALRTILYHQLDETLLHIAEVEARHGAATTSSAFTFHQGVLLQPREREPAPLTRYAELWTSDGRPLLRSRNLHTDLELPPEALAAARQGRIGWATATWQGAPLRSVVYPLEFVGAVHGGHLLQVAARTDAVERTLSEFALLLVALSLVATAGAFVVGWRLAGVALRPTAEITAQAEAIEAGTLSERITAHADVQEFSRLVTVLNGMLDRLESAFEAQRRFTADASHELRAPLTVLRGDIDVALKRDRSPDEYRETLERCREEVVQMSRLAADLLVLARTDAGLPLERREEVDLRDLGCRVADRFAAVAAARGVRVEVTGEPAIVRGDEPALERAVSNLVDNAIKHSSAPGLVRLQVQHDHRAVLTVSDTGPGVPPELVPRLFTRFFRGDPARPRSDSHGLGLAIAQAIAEAHRGSLDFVGNAPGAVFRLTLPLVPSAEAQFKEL
ncbi:MAG TPA: ATP-binding protein [Gemmatimonadales bacterium]|nr:ATP-binding protein [Gemmatimonadales bacterium]